MRALLVGLLAGLLLAGCFTQEGSQSTAPPPAPAAPAGPLGNSSTGCLSNASVGAGNGDITSDHACNATGANPSV